MRRGPERADPVDPDDVRVLDLRHGSGLEQEPLAGTGVEVRDELDRDRPGQYRVFGDIDTPRRPSAELASDHVIIELLRWVDLVENGCK